MPGDVDQDGYITDKDAVYLLKYLSGTYSLTDAQIDAAKVTDITKENPDMSDVIWILRNRTAD